ncbi:MAG: hypothetical protein R2912_05755 [Eubacteriales bacterium]
MTRNDALPAVLPDIAAYAEAPEEIFCAAAGPHPALYDGGQHLGSGGYRAAVVGVDRLLRGAEPQNSRAGYSGGRAAVRALGVPE